MLGNGTWGKGDRQEGSWDSQNCPEQIVKVMCRCGYGLPQAAGGRCRGKHISEGRSFRWSTNQIRYNHLGSLVVLVSTYSHSGGPEQGVVSVGFDEAECSPC